METTIYACLSALLPSLYAISTVRRANDNATEAVKAAHELVRDIQAAAAISQGVHPHHASPATFAPDGASVKHHETQQRAQVIGRLRAGKEQHIRQLEQAIKVNRQRGLHDEAKTLEATLEATRKQLEDVA